MLDLFDIHPDIDLDLMKPDQNLAKLTADLFTALDPVLQKVNPDWILVQGDTTTVMAAALLAYYRHIRVGHVEAGLRSGDKWQPFPEEINRKVVVWWQICICSHPAKPGKSATRRRAGLRIHITGNTSVDALFKSCSVKLRCNRLVLQELGVSGGERTLVLVTAHGVEFWENVGRYLCCA